MKYLLLIFFMAGFVYGQQVEILIRDTTGAGIYAKPNDLKQLGTKNDATHSRLPVDVKGTVSVTAGSLATSAKQDTAIARLTLLQKYSIPANKIYSDDSLTVATEIDSVTAPTGTLVWYTADIVGVTDTIEVSFTKTFANKKKVYQGMTVFFQKLSVASFPKLYIRRRGVSGTSVYDLTMFAY